MWLKLMIHIWVEHEGQEIGLYDNNKLLLIGYEVSALYMLFKHFTCYSFSL